MFRTDPGDPGYGLSPLAIAPRADSRWRRLSADDVLAPHPDRLQRDQQADGGWPITWEPPGEAALLEWRGIVTLDGLRTLVSYGRLSPSRQPSGLRGRTKESGWPGILAGARRGTARPEEPLG